MLLDEARACHHAHLAVEPSHLLYPGTKWCQHQCWAATLLCCCPGEPSGSCSWKDFPSTFSPVMHYRDESNSETYFCSNMRGEENAGSKISYKMARLIELHHWQPFFPHMPSFQSWRQANRAHQTVSPETAMKSQGLLWSGACIMN